jgi:hypothetical protein
MTDTQESTTLETVDIPILLNNLSLMASKHHAEGKLPVTAKFMREAVTVIESLQAKLNGTRRALEVTDQDRAELHREIERLRGALVEQHRMFEEWLDDMGYDLPETWPEHKDGDE